MPIFTKLKGVQSRKLSEIWICRSCRLGRVYFPFRMLFEAEIKALVNVRSAMRCWTYFPVAGIPERVAERTMLQGFEPDY